MGTDSLGNIIKSMQTQRQSEVCGQWRITSQENVWAALYL